MRRQHRKVCGEKATNDHTDWNFECALKKIICVYISVRQNRKSANYMRQHKYLLNSSY